MSKKILALGIALSCISSAALAQDNRFEPRTYGSLEVTGAVYSDGAKAAMQEPAIENTAPQESRVIIYPVEERAATTAATINAAPVTAPTQNVVKAQYIKSGDVSPSEYQALLDEADRIRAYQSSNGQFTGVTMPSQPAKSSTNGDYEIDLYAPAAVSKPATMPVVTQKQTSQTTQASGPATHRVQKGDTLYNISKRYNLSVDAIKSANGLSDSNIRLGQVLTLSQMTRTIDAGTQIPMTTTLVRNVEPVPGSANIYAVLPKDTLYAISRRSCVSVADIISANTLLDPNALKPGQRLNIPAGHCLK